MSPEARRANNIDVVGGLGQQQQQHSQHQPQQQQQHQHGPQQQQQQQMSMNLTGSASLGAMNHQNSQINNTSNTSSAGPPPTDHHLLSPSTQQQQHQQHQHQVSTGDEHMPGLYNHVHMGQDPQQQQQQQQQQPQQQHLTNHPSKSSAESIERWRTSFCSTFHPFNLLIGGYAVIILLKLVDGLKAL